jgi:hypothetical protein
MKTANYSFNGRPRLDIPMHEIEKNLLEALTGLNRLLAERLIEHGYWRVKT